MIDHEFAITLTLAEWNTVRRVRSPYRGGKALASRLAVLLLPYGVKQ
jgi:hypothetical protein